MLATDELRDQQTSSSDKDLLNDHNEVSLGSKSSRVLVKKKKRKRKKKKKVEVKAENNWGLAIKVIQPLSYWH